MIRLISTAAAFLIVLIGVNISPVRGQARNNPPTSGPWNMEEERQKAQQREAINSTRNGSDGSSSGARGADNRPYSFDFDRDLRGKQEKKLRPTAVERAAYAQFLKQPHAGL